MLSSVLWEPAVPASPLLFLTVGFGVPIHTALAVALASMTFTMLSGAYSHFREHEVVVKVAGQSAAAGWQAPFWELPCPDHMPSDDLSFMTGLMILSSALILYVKLYHADWLNRHLHGRRTLLASRKLYIYGIPTGIVSDFWQVPSASAQQPTSR